MQSIEELAEQAWIDVLAHVYRTVDWKRVARGRSSLDIFEHRLRFSMFEPDVPSVIDKLCNTLGLQAPWLPLDKIDILRKNEKVALKILRKMPKLLTLYASEKAKQLKKGQKTLFD